MEDFSILIVEDSDSDYDKTHSELVDAGIAEQQLRRAKTIKGALRELFSKVPTLILLDFSLPDSFDVVGLQTIRQNFPKVPIVLFSGIEDEETALKTLEVGAQDFVSKRESGSRLMRSIRFAVHRHKERLSLEGSKDDALEESAAKTRLIAGVGHDLRVPMAAIVSAAELLTEDESSDKEGLKRVISANAKYLQELVESVIELARVQSGSLQLHFSEERVVDFVDDVTSCFKQMAVQKGLEFVCDITYPIPKTIVVDKLRFQQVLYNLLSNAITHTSEGQIRFAIEFDESTSKLSFEIADTGRGMNKKQLRSAFDYFKQAHSDSASTGGFGLGLSLVRQLCKKLNLDISCASEEGKGTKFTIIAPVFNNPELLRKKEASDMHESKQENDSLIQVRGQILICDDSEDIREVIRYQLGKLGVGFLECDNGKDALRVLGNEQVDLVLLDMRMPVMSGFKLTEEVRALGNRVPIVGVSAEAGDEIRERCLELGCNEYLTKPFKAWELQALVALYLNNSGEEPVLLEHLERELEDLDEDELEEDLVEIKRLALSFLEALPERLHTVLRGLKSGELEAVGQAIHKLKSSGLFGYTEIGRVAAELEDALAQKVRPYSLVIELFSCCGAALTEGEKLRKNPEYLESLVKELF